MPSTRGAACILHATDDGESGACFVYFGGYCHCMRELVATMPCMRAYLRTWDVASRSI
jgi:hypothetical protein